MNIRLGYRFRRLGLITSGSDLRWEKTTELTNEREEIYGSVASSTSLRK